VYEHFYGLRERPFELTPNPRFVYLTPRHREALSTIRYGLRTRRGLTLLIGEAGTGKTTILEVALHSPGVEGVKAVRVTNPTLERGEFIEQIARGFGIDPSGTKVAVLARIEALVRQIDADGGVAALVVDEAQSLPGPLLEEIRLLANMETRERKLLQVVLAGQPEFAARLETPELRQFRQRIAVRSELQRLTLDETAALISGRLRIAGADPTTVFTTEAVRAIYAHSYGIPRVVAVICDNALVAGFATDTRPIDEPMVRSVCREFGFTPCEMPPRSVEVRPPAASVVTVRAAAVPVEDAPKVVSAAPARNNGTRVAAARVKEPPMISAPRRPMFSDVGRSHGFAFLLR
jgi:general secretion pathway protein A